MLLQNQNLLKFITYNDTQVYLSFLFNIYNKLKYEDERFKTYKEI